MKQSFFCRITNQADAESRAQEIENERYDITDLVAAESTTRAKTNGWRH